MAYDEDLANRIREFMGPEEGVSEKKMFGGLAFLINGHMAVAASSQGGLLARVDPSQTESLLSKTNAEIMIMRGRSMPGWLHVTSENIVTDHDLEEWIKRCVDYTRALPAKN